MKRLQKNFFYQFSYQILAILLPLITSPYISRVLGANGVGVYSYTFTVANYFYIICMLGFDTYGQRLIAANQKYPKKRNKVFTELLLLQIAVTFIVSIIYVGYIFTQAGERQLLAIIQFLHVASSFTNIIWLFEGVEEFKNVTTRNMIVKLASCILIFLCVKEQSDIWLYTLIMAGSTFAGNLLLVAYAHKYVSLDKPNWYSMLNHMKPIFMLFVPQIGITIFMQMDKLMIGWWSTTRQLGYYQNAEKIINIPITLILTVGVVIMPRIVSLQTDGETEQVKRYNSLCMEFLLALGVGCMFGLIAVAKDFVPWFFGEDFSESTSTLSLLSVQIVFMAWENVLQKQYLVPYGMDKVVATAMTVAAIINVLLNLWLIPQYAATGAIVGSLGAHIVICIFEGIVLRKELPVLRYSWIGISFVIPGVIMCGCVLLFARNVTMRIMTMKIICEILIGIAVYVPLLFAVLKLEKSAIWDVFCNYIDKFKKKVRLN